MERKQLVSHLDQLLQINAMEDSSWNGLQVEGQSEVTKLGIAVDACLQTIQAAARKKCHMMLVHHGLFWGKGVRITGVDKQRISKLLAAEMSVYAAHLPLDAHPEFGNNALILRLLGIDRAEPFGHHRGQVIGCQGQLPHRTAREQVCRTLNRKLQTKCQRYEFGPRTVKRVGVISGEGGFGIYEAAECGVDLLITGEWDHAKYHFAREHKINVITAGHYKTETVGVLAVAQHLEQQFGLRWVFLDFPTGL